MSSDMANIHSAGSPQPLAEHFVEHRRSHSHVHRSAQRPLRVMKFGGTSVSDALCIRRVAEIVQDNAHQHELVVVVSAMAGVTNMLIEAGTHAASKNLAQAERILKQLQEQHTGAIAELIDSASERNEISSAMKQLFELCRNWCQNAASRGELTAQENDSISSLGERLSAPLVAAVLRARGLASQSFEATELVITDSEYGSASPQMDLTTERCEFHLRPLLRRGVVPVVTGFIGAAENGGLTTLGRGGSDYSATILGASLRADDVIIWTDVDGMLTADPRLIHDASTIPEISYREASELAYFGAKVLHPKTLHPMMHNGIPVWIRNTFAPDKAGTRITPTGSANTGGVKALTAVSDAALITIEGVNEAGEALGRAVAAAKSVRTDVLMVSQSGMRENTYMVVAATFAQRTLEALRREFTSDLKGNKNRVSMDSSVSILTVVGEDLRAVKGIVERAVSALAREGVQTLAMGQGSSACHISFVVRRTDMQAALIFTHREFEPNANSPQHKGSGLRECRTMTVVDDRRATDAGELDGIRSRLNRASSPAENIQHRELEVLEEELFRHMIARERKRSERSGKPMLLMLLDAGRFLPTDKSGRVLSNIMSALSLYTRDTDVIGWYKDNSVMGVMFTEIGIDDPGVILGTMMQRVSEALRTQLSLEKFSQISISWQVYPEHWDQESSTGNPAFYPDLEHRESSRRSALAVKRFIDVVGSLAAIAFLAPVFLVVAVLVKLSSKGPILYKQQRLGQFGRPFTFLKFRSMYVNNDPKIHRDFMKRVIGGEHDGKVDGEEKKVYKMTNDPRITPIGRFLRRASLDELPQFFNVLGGNMSLVGPRPPILYECQEYDIWHRRRVLEIKPGITGLWQITGRSRVRFDDMVRLDLQYTREWSIWLDLKILAKTPLAVVAGKDAF